MIDGTATLRGVTIGKETVYGLKTWPTGLLSTGTVRVEDQPRPRRNGVIAAPDYVGSRTVVFDVQVKAASQTASETAAAALSTAFAPGPGDVQLDVRVTGTPAEYSLFGRSRGCDIVIARDRWFSGIMDARCVFTATDPVRYAPSQSQAISIAAHTIPATLPFTLGLYGEQTITVSGTVDVDRWTVTFAAPAGGTLIYPRILHVGQNKLIQVDRTVGASNQLVLDGYSGTATLGTVDTEIVATSVSQWFSLTPGSNTLRFAAADGSHTSSTATLAWRPGWL